MESSASGGLGTKSPIVVEERSADDASKKKIRLVLLNCVYLHFSNFDYAFDIYYGFVGGAVLWFWTRNMGCK